ncbi:MAG TPA: NUDIX domain-containing protein [Candidatus Paceibacterota bacterium]|nr:NUDIX domain-containing protein [Candidatus Paceibacterota bacterium]
MARNVQINKSKQKKKIKFEVSVGIFLFRREKGKILWLLLHYPAGHWDFVKGHIEKNEKIEETIRRELAEETGIRNLKLIPRFQKTLQYWFNNKRYSGRDEMVFKRVIFLLGETEEKEIIISEEHLEGRWFTTKEALSIITFKNVKKYFLQAVAFLKKSGIYNYYNYNAKKDFKKNKRIGDN